jgi:hypothetical protein
VISLWTRGVHVEHQFRPDELEPEARAAGFSVVFHERKDHCLGVLMRAE